jgi:hypothetical protein
VPKAKSTVDAVPQAGLGSTLLGEKAEPKLGIKNWVCIDVLGENRPFVTRVPNGDGPVVIVGKIDSESLKIETHQLQG